jgi:hypothetical protein
VDKHCNADHHDEHRKNSLQRSARDAFCKLAADDHGYREFCAGLAL